jgi:uncharacterized protein YciI
MHFIVYALDKPGSGDLRAAHRDAHRARLRAPGMPLKVVSAGPMLDEAKNAIGSLLIVDAADIAAVRAFVEGDLYRRHGLWQSIDIRPFNWTIGAPPA